MEHANSHVITIFRAGNFLAKGQNKETEEYFAQTKESIGSYYEKKGNPKVGSGLTMEETDLLMPQIVDLKADDREFKKKVSEFFHDVTTNVPYIGGLKLETGLVEDNMKPVSKNNLPLNTMDFIRWRHAAGHPWVASTKDAATGNSLMKFYIFDPVGVQNKKKIKEGELDAAMGIYLKVKEDITQVDELLVLLGTDPRNFDGKTDKDGLKVERLRELATENPASFVKMHSDGNLSVRAWIRKGETVKVLSRLGDKYLDAETAKTIANSLQEMIAFWEDEDNSGDVTIFKARIQEALSKPIVTEQKRTVA